MQPRHAVQDDIARPSTPDRASCRAARKTVRELGVTPVRRPLGERVRVPDRRTSP